MFRYLHNSPNLDTWNHYYDMLCKYLIPVQAKLRHTVCQGDLNDWNILVTSENPKEELIRFDDSDHKACNDSYYWNNLTNGKSLQMPKVKVSAIIDYGDSHYSCLLHDIAIAVAYFMLRKERPMEALLEIIHEFNNVFPLEEIEIDLLFVAAMSRLLVSVTFAAYKIAHFPENTEYYLVHSGPAWHVLKKMKNQTPEAVAKLIRKRIQLGDKYCFKKSKI